jgi:ABC-2 type transport system ATP-binding protein
MIRIDNVSLFYETQQALDQLSLTIDSGKVTGLVGPNGAGKTSLIRVILGLIREFEGEITLDGHSTKRERKWIKHHCAYAPEETHLFSYLSGREFLLLIARLRQMTDRQAQKEIDFLIDLLGMGSFCDGLIDDYSHGMRQKMLISAALLHSPKFIFIDEALNGLDTEALLRLKDHLAQLAQKGHTIVLASHILPLVAEWCDEVVVMNRGKILRSFTRETLDNLLKQEEKTFTQVFVEVIEQANRNRAL